MALGFGFNKAKVLATAEKFVQQGKLQNAIAEYEKIVKEDPKDLTVLNTLGDLYARIGQHDHASQYFKRVGDHYAQDGFTVKAIAVYKKLTRQGPASIENINRLGELYSQQGLFSDARTQYMQVADHLLKAGDNNQAARVFQKILELDPENTATQSKLADLYLKLGKKADASKIYYTAAESLYARSSFDAADEALERVLSIEPDNGSARLLRGMIAADAGDSAAAVQHLERVPDLDSRPDALRALLRAQLQSGAMDGAEGVAGKMAGLHNDLSGISALAHWYVGNQQVARALKLYDTYSDRFLAGDRAAFEEAIRPLIGRVKGDAEALNTVSRLLQSLGNTSHGAEILELQAHDFAQKGDFKAARDLYKQLAELEPDNPLHNQNHKQMLSKLGEDPTMRALTPDQASQALMMEELEQGAPVVHQTYDPPTEKAIEAALTDAELFVSYNVPAKAIPPLEAVLPLAPRDVTVNQRLAALYARSARFADAARACQTLSEVYREQGHEAESARYLQAARNYASRAPGSSPVPTTAAPPATRPAAIAGRAGTEPAQPVHDILTGVEHPPAMEVEVPAEQPVSSVQEFSFDVPDHLLDEAHTAAAHADMQPAPIQEIHAPVGATAQDQPPAGEEFDVSNEWENMLTVESTELPVQPPTEIEVPAISSGEQAETAADPAAATEKIQEAQFYISQQMWDAAKKAILDLTEIAPDAQEITDLISAVSAGQSRAAAAAAAASAPPPSAASAPARAMQSEPAPPSPPAKKAPAQALEEIFRAPAGPPSTPSPKPQPVAAPAVAAKVGAPPQPPSPSAQPAAIAPAPSTRRTPQPATAPVAPAAPASVAQSDALEEILPEHVLVVPVEIEAVDIKPPAVELPGPAAASPVQAAPSPSAAPPLGSLLEDVFQTEIAPPARSTANIETKKRATEPLRPQPPSKAKDTHPEVSTEDILSDFVSDMEKSDLADFAPRAKPDLPPPHPNPALKAASPGTRAPAVLKATEDQVKKDTAPPLDSLVLDPGPAAPVMPAPPASSAVRNGDMHDAESASVLTDILSELQEDAAGESGPDEDPETHYNLGIAFKEMGLLDEAIGELQKVCHSMDRGHIFSQPIQAYTWLAQCLVDKGAPEAAVRWYKRALQLPLLDDGSRCAIYYDLALAYEASGDKKSALANFMEVYGSNIDFRDVASRIKALKS